MADTQASPGTTAGGGRYAIHAEIGSGGMATVHLGRLVGARGFARTVAIKVLHASYAKNKDFVERFLDEARIVGRIHHPNVMPTLDVIAEGEDLRIVMDYVAGEALDQLQAKVQARGERIPVHIACAIVAGALHGLHAAHEAKNEFGEPLGIVHLDVSPQNILVGTDGTSRVLDFGVARARATTERAGALVTGKSAYLAPEQIRRGEVTPRTDVFAASIVLWELITGEPLFAADNHAATMQRVMSGDIPAPTSKVPGVPPRLDALLMKGLARDPNQRFHTAREMALEIEQTVAPALPSEVGRWVETVAEPTLIARAAQVRSMEAESARNSQSPEVVAPRAMYAEQAAANAVNLGPEDLEDDLSGKSLLRPPGGKDAVPQRAADGSIRWQPRSAKPAEPQFVLEGGPRGRRGLGVTSTPVAPDAKARLAGRRKTIAVAAGAAVVLVGVVLLVARVALLPGYVRSAAIGTAAAHGVTLTVDDASLGDDGVELKGLTAKLAGVPQVSCTVASAQVRSIWSSVSSVALGKTEVLVDGDARGVLDALAGWSAAHRGKAKSDVDSAGGHIEVPVAHLVWTHAGSGVGRVEANGLQGTIGSPTSAALGDEAHFVTSALSIETQRGAIGPWSVDVGTTLNGTRARVAFDPAVPDGANALLVLDALGDTSFDVSIPRLAAASLGIPRTAVGADVPFPQQLELAVHYGRANHEQSTASLKGALYGLRIDELGGVVDAHVNADAAGPTGSPLTLKTGLVTLGALRAVVTGTLAPSGNPAALRGNLAWKADPVPCSALVGLPTPAAAARDLTRKAAEGDLGDFRQLARDFGALGEAVGAVKVTGAFAASGTVVFDSTDLAHAKVASAAKNACGLALFQGNDAPPHATR